MRVSVKKDEKCKHVHANSTIYWRSVTKGNRTHTADMVRMNLATKCGAFNHTELMSYNPRDPPSSWEQIYFSYPPLRNISDTVVAQECRFELLNSSQTDFKVGDKVMFKIVLKTGLNESRKEGGDIVHVRLVSTTLGASTAADVIDNNDGSYLASSLLPWSGKVQVKVAIIHSRELFRTAFFIQRIFKTSHGFTGMFMNSQASESTPCSSFPAIQSFPSQEVCNLTVANGGFPWYCGMPVKKDVLNCSDWVSVRRMDQINYIPLTEAEEEIIRLSETQGASQIPPNNVILTVKLSSRNHTVIERPAIMCNQRHLSLTFNDTNQSGYFYNNTWIPYDCKLPRMDNVFLSTCLRNTQMIMIGDSNTRQQMGILAKIVNCTQKIDRTKVAWHAPLQCDNDAIGLSIKYFPPKEPFYGSTHEDIPIEALHSSVILLDSIPSTGNYLVYLHHFLHLITFHLSVAEHRFRLLRAAIERLLARNSKAYVIYQSVHSAYDTRLYNKNKLNVFLLILQRNIFSGLGDRVMFTLTWPMTIAVGNKDGHPPIRNQFTAVYMGYMCGRW
uniref:NXPE C-terminal domain-containing protein n=2 Tax=Arion vulgaris TaxID=1028688 RepID=A0A0B7A9D9_9EUPU